MVTAAADPPDSALRKGGSEEVKITKERLSGVNAVSFTMEPNGGQREVSGK